MKDMKANEDNKIPSNLFFPLAKMIPIFMLSLSKEICVIIFNFFSGIGAGANVADWADEVPVTGGAIQPEIVMGEEWGKVEDWTSEPVQPMAPVDPTAAATTPSWGGSAPGETWD